MGTRLYAHLLGSPEDHTACLNTIVTREPMMQYVIDLLNNLCLKRGVSISIAATKPDKEFQAFFEENFVSILPSVLRYKLYCGFLPWILHQHPVTGDKMPMLLPLGSFSWHVRTKPMDNQGKKKSKTSSSWGIKSPESEYEEMSSNNNMDYNCATEFVVSSEIGCGKERINVINLIDPMLISINMGGHANSVGQSEYSPLYVAMQKYLALDMAQQRRCYADDWNCTARLFTTKTPPSAVNERAGRDEIPYGTTRFQQAQMPSGFFTYDNQKLQYQRTASIVQDALEQPAGKNSDHVPAVYSLPAHYNLVQPPDLKPLLDVELLERQYRIAVTQSLGIPLHLIDSDTGSTSRNMSADDLPFSSELVKNTCESLTKLMQKVLVHMYSSVYHGDEAKRLGAVAACRVRFLFATEELYSESMKYREDEKVRLQKSVAGNDNTTRNNTGASTSSSSVVASSVDSASKSGSVTKSAKGSSSKPGASSGETDS